MNVEPYSVNAFLEGFHHARQSLERGGGKSYKRLLRCLNLISVHKELTVFFVSNNIDSSNSSMNHFNSIFNIPFLRVERGSRTIKHPFNNSKIRFITADQAQDDNIFRGYHSVHVEFDLHI